MGSNDSYLYAIKPDGKLKWKYKTNGSIKSAPIIMSDGTIYVGTTEGRIYALTDK